MASYPEHEKLRAVKEESQAIGNFLTWLREDQHVAIARPHRHDQHCYVGQVRACGLKSGELFSVDLPVERWLSLYFDVDEARLDDEKRAMLDEQRILNNLGRTP